VPEILVCEEHSQIYEIWQERRQSGLKLAHIDFHCDMRGLLLDIRRSRAYLINAAAPNIQVIDSGNFIAHAVIEGVVSSVRWIHDIHGGRRYDAGAVKFESDLTALSHRLLHYLRHDEEVPIMFEEITFDDWDGVRCGEHLDIDWDGIASIEYELPYIRRLMESFLDRGFNTVPETTYLAYSPGYSHPDRRLFEEFLERLALKFSAEIKRLPQPKLRPGYPQPPQDLAPSLRLKNQLVLKLRRLGIY